MDEHGVIFACGGFRFRILKIKAGNWDGLPEEIRMNHSSQSITNRIRLRLLPRGLTFAIAVLLAGGSRMAAEPQAAAPKASAAITFEHDIAPIFHKSCMPCHGAEKPQGGLRLDSEAATLKGGEPGKVIIPGDSEKSVLVERLLGVGEEARMPMGADPLPASQIALIRAWIDQNAFEHSAGEQQPPAGQAVPGNAESLPVAAHAQGAGEGVFAEEIRPILASRCYRCHGPELQQNGLRLDSLAALLKGSANGPVVVPGESGRSMLVRRLEALDRPQMPYGGPPLSSTEIASIRKWIDQGAKGPDSSALLPAGKPIEHWAYVKPVRPDLPKVKDAAWCR